MIGRGPARKHQAHRPLIEPGIWLWEPLNGCGSTPIAVTAVQVQRDHRHEERQPLLHGHVSDMGDYAHDACG